MTSEILVLFYQKSGQQRKNIVWCRFWFFFNFTDFKLNTHILCLVIAGARQRQRQQRDTHKTCQKIIYFFILFLDERTQKTTRFVFFRWLLFFLARRERERERMWVWSIRDMQVQAMTINSTNIVNLLTVIRRKKSFIENN